MTAIPQCRIVQTGSDSVPEFTIHQQIDGKRHTIDATFSDYQAALDYVLSQGWQLERDRPKDSMIIASRFLKP